MAEQEALFPIRSLISHILTFLVSFVFVSSSIITSGIYYLEHNYLEKFQIPSISEWKLCTIYSIQYATYEFNCRQLRVLVPRQHALKKNLSQVSLP